MNILQIISGRDVNGALIYCRLLSERLAERGHAVTLLCRPGSWISEYRPAGVSVVTLPLRWRPGGDLPAVGRMVRELGIELVHSHQSRAHNFAALLRQRTGTPSVATAHARIMQLHWRFHDLVLANSHATAQFLRSRRLVHPARLETVYCYADIQRFASVRADRGAYMRGELHARDGRFLVGVVGEVTPRKGHRYLFEALPAIVRAIPDARLVLIGRFHRQERLTRSLRQFQLRHGLLRRVHWLGRRQNVEDYLQALDVLVVPSIEEPLGLVAVEAQAAGIPVIAADVGGLPEIVKHNETGLLVPPRDPAGIAEAVLRMHGDGALRKRLASAARESAISMFDPGRLTTAVETCYQRLLGRRAN